MPRDFCVHGHFYQPPREDPFSGIIATEPGAEPFNNWNEKIYARCYQPNAEMGNFRKISFNIGPTLFNWLEQNHPRTYHQILDQERENFQRYAASNAMAQACYHPILPLASRRDKTTSILWGIHDYQHRYGHSPDGMWLPECAVDIETLEVLAEEGILFTILAPWQAATHQLDVTQPYRVELSGGRSMSVFFYHSGLSTCISFNADATVNADAFIQNNLKNAYADSSNDQLILLASDGELYGHHQSFRDKFLNYLLNGSLSREEIEYTYPGRWIKEHPPVKVAHIRERTSWSCDEGVRRWEDACGCTPDSSWKRPLRNFMDATAGLVDEQYLRLTRGWLKDPWQARDDFIRVVLGDQSFSGWENEQAARPLHNDEAQVLRCLLKAQFERQRMYTSCGWFFEEFDRIEPRNNIRYAAHALVLTESASGEDLLPKVMPLLRQIRDERGSSTAEEMFEQAVRRFKENA